MSRGSIKALRNKETFTIRFIAYNLGGKREKRQRFVFISSKVEYPGLLTQPCFFYDILSSTIISGCPIMLRI